MRTSLSVSTSSTQTKATLPQPTITSNYYLYLLYRLTTKDALYDPGSLHSAIAEGYFDTARFYLHKGADANQKDSNGNTPLHVLANLENHDEAEVASLTKELILHGAKPNSRNKIGTTPVQAAATHLKAGLIETLISYGANINQPGEKNLTPLQLTISEISDLAALSHLLKIGLIRSTKNWMILSREQQHIPTLYAICQQTLVAKMKILDLLLAKGANPNATTSNGNSALHAALQPDDKITLPSQFFLGEVHITLVHKLLKHGANPLQTDRFNRTPMQYLAKNYGRYNEISLTPIKAITQEFWSKTDPHVDAGAMTTLTEHYELAALGQCYDSRLAFRDTAHNRMFALPPTPSCTTSHADLVHIVNLLGK